MWCDDNTNDGGNGVTENRRKQREKRGMSTVVGEKRKRKMLLKNR